MKSIILCFGVVVSVGFSAQARQQWDLNDVTYLMPLPESIEHSHLLKMSDQGVGGDLIPLSVVNDLPNFSLIHDKSVLIKNMRLLAVRIDPCFSLPTPTDCQKQLRMVWQPLEMNSEQKVSTVDVALHSFYVLTDSEFEKMLLKIADWKNRFKVQVNQMALSVHPAFQTNAESLVDFNNLLLNFAGSKNLTRVTVSLLRRRGDVWGFLALGVSDKANELLAIPRLDGQKSQLFFNDLGTASAFANAAISPSPKTEDANLSSLVENPESYTEDDLIEKMQIAYRIENPNIFNPENMDCVNCHIAQPAKEWMSSKIKKALYSKFEYKNKKYNLTNLSTQKFNTQQVRALGYFNRDVAISQRVINESAAVADRLNKNNSSKAKKDKR